jgi:c-di-GMP-binding flagellar brake protein YcgR
MNPDEKETKSHIGIVNFEKRKHPRFSVDLPVEYYRINSSIRHSSRALNASEGGLLIYFSEQMEVGQRLKVKLFFASGSELNAIEVLAEVVWTDIHLDKDWGDYRCGVRFTDISSEDMIKLKHFLRTLSE